MAFSCQPQLWKGLLRLPPHRQILGNLSKFRHNQNNLPIKEPTVLLDSAAARLVKMQIKEDETVFPDFATAKSIKETYIDFAHRSLNVSV